MYKSSRVLNLSFRRFLNHIRTKISVVTTEQKFKEICFKNEPILQYKPNSNERCKLKEALNGICSNMVDIPLVIDGEEMISEDVCYQGMPHRHAFKIAKFYHADEKCINTAIRAAGRAQKQWDRTLLRERIEIWEKAADLMSTKYRPGIVAATMLGQGKTVIQAEIDLAELIDYIRINASYLKLGMEYEPINENVKVAKNSIRFRGLDGFVAAISPFNATSIAGNLAYTPALMGNGVVWKPSDSAVLSNWLIYKIMCEAGVPPGVINFVPSKESTFGDTITNSRALAGINFSGPMPAFKKLWALVGSNIQLYLNFPRLIGECGGKNFHFVHKTADVDTVVASTIRSAFEYSGQKCSSCSRLYVPESLWESKIKKPLADKTNELILGDVTDSATFLSAVIDSEALKRSVSYIEFPRGNCAACTELIAGGKFWSLRGHFVRPTILLVKDPRHPLMTEQISGPILAVYVYKDSELEQAMDLVVTATKFSLAGSVFGKDRAFLKQAVQKFKMAAGNLYINDKSTDAVVGQQPFGGSNMSGTNDKTGGPHYIFRWTTQQSIKETFVPKTDIYYPYMDLEKKPKKTKALEQKKMEDC